MKKLFVMLALLASGCGLFTQENVQTAKDVVKTFDDLGQKGCEILYAETYGISFKEAADIYCNDERVQRFRDLFLAAAKDADAELGSKPPEQMK